MELAGEVIFTALKLVQIALVCSLKIAAVPAADFKI
jgi:hypothetical protein